MARLPPEAATEALMADLEGGSRAPDRDLQWLLVTAVANDPMTAVLLIAEGVRVESVGGGWVGKKIQVRGVEIKVTYYR